MPTFSIIRFGRDVANKQIRTDGRTGGRRTNTRQVITKSLSEQSSGKTKMNNDQSNQIDCVFHCLVDRLFMAGQIGIFYVYNPNNFRRQDFSQRRAYLARGSPTPGLEHGGFF